MFTGAVNVTFSLAFYLYCSKTHHIGLPLKPKEICRLYLIDRCEWDRRCHRFHPPEAERLQVRIVSFIHIPIDETCPQLLEVERSRQKLSQVCQSFLRGRCRWGVLCNYTHARPNDVQLDESTTLSKTLPLQVSSDCVLIVGTAFLNSKIRILKSQAILHALRQTLMLRWSQHRYILCCLE